MTEELFAAYLKNRTPDNILSMDTFALVYDAHNDALQATRELMLADCAGKLGKSVEAFNDARGQALSLKRIGKLPAPADRDVFGRTEQTPVMLIPQTATELVAKELKPVEFVVDGLIPQGLALLASPPKYGKSWMVLDLCISVASGKHFLRHKTRNAGCLYLALEDSENRLQDRLLKVLDGANAPNDFYYLLQAPDLAHGLTEQIEGFLQQVPTIKLIVVDTLQKIRGTPGGRDSAYGADYKDMALLKTLADKYRLCVLLVHHLRKMGDDGDPFNRISGTAGIMGAADTAITLTRAKRSDEETRLTITGRDVDSNELILRFDKSVFRWRVVGNADEVDEQRAREEYESSPIVHTIKKLLEQNPAGWCGTMKDLMEAGKFISKSYLADTVQSLTRKVAALEQPLFEYDRITHTRTKNGSGGGKHRFEQTNVDEKWSIIDSPSPFL